MGEYKLTEPVMTRFDEPLKAWVHEMRDMLLVDSDSALVRRCVEAVRQKITEGTLPPWVGMA